MFILHIATVYVCCLRHSMALFTQCLLIGFILTFFLFGGKTQRTGVNPCGNINLIPCDNSECIPRSHWCDGWVDCRDKSDEDKCKKSGILSKGSYYDCTEKHFACRNGPCIPIVAQCDNIPDCGDRSDEKDCEENTFDVSYIATTCIPVTRATYTDPVRHISSATLPPSTNTRRSTSTSTRSTYTSTRRPIYSTTRFTPTSRSTDYAGKKWREDYKNTPRNPYDHNGYGPFDNRDNRQRQNGRPSKGSDLGPGENYPDYTQSPDLQPTHEHSSRYTPGNRQPTDHWSTDRTTAATPLPDRRDIDLSGYPRSPYAQRQPPMLIQPRLVLHPPAPRQLYYNRKRTSYFALPQFSFTRNYTEDIGSNYKRNVDSAKNWLIDRRDSSYTWGEDTPRALVALSLITNSFSSEIAENDLMKKGLQTHLGIKLLRGRTHKISTPKHALYINALLATCQNPRDFLGLDLVNELYEKFILERTPFAYLTLCLSDSSLQQRDIEHLESLLFPRFSDEVAKDQHILAISAVACVLQQNNERHYQDKSQMNNLRRKIHEAAQNLLRQRNDDGSFGSIYSTAIAAQALMSVDSMSWDPRPTLDYLAENQSEDGSFGDMLSTYYSVPALSGRSLLHLRNTWCDQKVDVNEPRSPEDILYGTGPRKDVLYSIAMGYPTRWSFSLQLNVPEDTTLFDMMRVAEFLDPRFKFRYNDFYERAEVYAIAGVPNDPERQFHWNLYKLQQPSEQVDLRQRQLGNIKEIIPRDSEEILYWYLQTN